LKKKDNMRSNMQLNEEDCIRYLMREMDPSEEIEFEREMLSNQDLLIEVESLRSTYNKVKKLPTKETPQEVLDRVKDFAIKEQQSKLNRSSRIIGWFGKSVAAVATILLMASAGIYFYGSVNDVSIKNNSSNMIQAANQIQPWVDRNEIISVSDRVDENRAQIIGEEYNNSYNKLTPVNSVGNVRPQRQDVLLTRSRQN